MKIEKSAARLKYEANCHDFRGDVSLVSNISALILSFANVVEDHPVLKTAVDIVYYSSVVGTVFSAWAHIRKEGQVKESVAASGEGMPQITTKHFFTRRKLYRRQETKPEIKGNN